MDRLPDGSVRVIDYKTGHASKTLLKPEKTDLQMGIYAMALPRLLQEPDLPPGVAEYWCLAEGKKGTIPLSELRLDKVRAAIDEAIEGMLSGKFERGEKCGGFCGLMGG